MDYNSLLSARPSAIDRDRLARNQAENQPFELKNLNRPEDIPHIVQESTQEKDFFRKIFSTLREWRPNGESADQYKYSSVDGFAKPQSNVGRHANCNAAVEHWPSG